MKIVHPQPQPIIISTELEILFRACNTLQVAETMDIYTISKWPVLTWQSIPYSIPSRFGFVNGNLGFGFLGDSLLRYSDDSLTFLRTISGYDLSSAYLCFFDSLKWLVMVPVNSGTNEIAVILRTTNAGLTFHPIVIDSAEQFILPANFHNENIAFIKTSSGYPYKTTDAGLTWVRLPIDSTKRGLDF